MALRFMTTVMIIGICTAAVFSVYENSRTDSAGFALATSAPDLADVAVGADRGGRTAAD